MLGLNEAIEERQQASLAAGIAGEGGVEFHASFLTKLLEDHKRLEVGISNEEGVRRAVRLGPAQVGDLRLVGEVPLGIDEDEAHFAADVLERRSCRANVVVLGERGVDRFKLCLGERTLAVLVLGEVRLVDPALVGEVLEAPVEAQAAGTNFLRCHFHKC